jgi:anionic cell wall polymer biosynthesis LytR-Cps2A-Psr (LCP) family protein
MKKLGLIAAIGITVLLASFLGLFFAMASRLALFEIFINLTPTAPLMANTNVLVVGVDNAFGHRSDTIMVLHTDPSNRGISLVSIPRDTLVVLPDRGLDKINHAYAYGGIELTRKTVENFLGVEIP